MWWRKMVMEGISRRKEYEASRVEVDPTIIGQGLMTKLNPWIGGVWNQPIKEGILKKECYGTTIVKSLEFFWWMLARERREDE